MSKNRNEIEVANAILNRTTLDKIYIQNKIDDLRNNRIPELDKRIESAKSIQIYEHNCMELDKQKLADLKEKL